MLHSIFISFFSQISVILLGENHLEKESFFSIQDSLFCFCMFLYTYTQPTSFRTKEYFVWLSGRSLFK